jgi:tRNA(Ile)-lysidine synthase
MLQKIEEALRRYDIDSRDRVLLALSGGLDSVALLHALLRLGYQPHLAHCNFKLRGQAADQDQAFCEELARRHNLKIALRQFNTQAYADEKALSTQMAARELRYNFFEALDGQSNYRAILTAHHGDDQIETVLFKLARGSALAAVAGIREQRQKYLRPMLGILREEIEAFARQHEIEWREDASNADTKYLRNAYRHRLLPLWQEIQPDLKTKLLESSRLLREQDLALDSLLEEVLENKLRMENDIEYLDWDTICRKAYFPQLLFKWLAPKGAWDWQAVNQLWEARKGRYTENEAFRLYQGDGHYELRPREEVSKVTKEIKKEDRFLTEPLAMELRFLSSEELSIDGKPEHHYLDAEKLQFPLILRTWKEGDRFQPLGMSGTKKLSDYWIDQKIAMAEKGKQLVLESGGEIVALIGHRIDHRFRVRNSTKTIYFVRLKK